MYRRISGVSTNWSCRLVIFGKAGKDAQLPFMTTLRARRSAGRVRSIAGAPPALGHCAKMAARPEFPFRMEIGQGNFAFRKILSDIALRPVAIRKKGVAWDLLFPDQRFDTNAETQTKSRRDRRDVRALIFS
jgi:hypothetical protein